MGALLIATLLSLGVVLVGGALVLLVTAAGALFASPLCAIALFGILSFRKFAKRLPDPYAYAPYPDAMDAARIEDVWRSPEIRTKFR